MQTRSKYITLDCKDPNFVFCPDGITMVARAALSISLDCPEQYRTIIADAFNRGWVKPVANMRDTEYTMELLKK